jgi:hypothetical protein
MEDLLDGPSRDLERWGVMWRKIPWPKNHAGKVFFAVPLEFLLQTIPV